MFQRRKKIERLPLTDFIKENYRRNRDADIEYRYMHTWGGGLNWESITHLYAYHAENR